MTREEAKKAAEVMLAFANGEKIEQYYNYDHKWLEVMSRGCDFNWLTNSYRIKPKEKFDSKTLQPFDKVLARDANDREWLALLFSHINTKGKVIVAGCAWEQVIPYNDETKHLIGTDKEAPEYYRYWED